MIAQRQEVAAPQPNCCPVSTHQFRGNELIIARNPKPDSRLPYIVCLPVPGRGPVVLATSATWPGPKDLFCLELDGWPETAEEVQRVPVQACWQAGQAVHLVVRRRQRRRSIFVWTRVRGRPVVFWRTQKTMQAARPGLKVPQARGLDGVLAIAVDVRERYPWRFSRLPARCTVRELPVGDYALVLGDSVHAAIERKTPENLAASAVEGTLAFTLSELSRLPRACVVVEGRFSDLLKASSYVSTSWLLNVVAALQANYPNVPWLFAETRALAEELAFRWLAACRKAALNPEAPLYEPPPAQGRLRLAAREGTAAAQAYGNKGEASGSMEPGGPPGAGDASPPRVLDRTARLNEALRLADAGHVWTSREYAAHFGVGIETARQDLARLVHAGAMRAEGAGRHRRYVRS